MNHKPKLCLDSFERQVIMCAGGSRVRYSIYTAAYGETSVNSVERSEMFLSNFRKIHMGKIVTNTSLNVAFSRRITEYRSINKHRSTHVSVCLCLLIYRIGRDRPSPGR